MKKALLKSFVVFLALNILLETLYPTLSWALTGGPSQPEVESFEPIGTTNMVDPFTGDFVYNIPLLDVGGYPINISHHSGVTMDQEASWVGLGWNINPGVINRSMRGVPDDFDGDLVYKETNIKPNRTYGLNIKIEPELFGLTKKGKAKKKAGKKPKGSISFGMGISYNNYRGFSFSQSVSASISVGDGGKGNNTSALGLGANIKSSNTDGLTIQPSLSFQRAQSTMSDNDNVKTTITKGGSISAMYNSRGGLKDLGFSASVSKEKQQYTRMRTGELEKDGDATGSGKSVSGNLSFGMPTFVPQSSLPMVNKAVTISPKLGISLFGLDALLYVDASYAEQKLDKNTDTKKAFGYMNAHKGMSSANKGALLDFNREKDGEFSNNTPRLPVTNFTYDLYQVSGQGIGGLYRPFRSDVGYVYDPYVKTRDDSYSLGVDLAAGNLIKGGLDPSYTRVRSVTQKWSKDNPVLAKQKFTSKQTNSDFEPFYFKEVGELTVDDDDQFLQQLGGTKPARVELISKGGLKVGTSQKLIRVNDTDVDISSPVKRSVRKKRNQNISFLTVKESKNFAIRKDLLASSTKPDHHIGEMSVLRPDGSRYVYGLPAYNTLQREVTFAVGKSTSKDLNSFSTTNGLVNYAPNDDNTMGNGHGLDNYYSKTDLPPFAHSYLLTSIVSVDYVDNDGVPGPTKGDIGSYTLFNYDRVDNFKWRIPTELNQANYNEGFKASNTDDQGNYVYGEKELYYLSSIETKDYKAVFEFGARDDGYDVIDENGGTPAPASSSEAPPVSKSKLLKSITLYHKNDYDQTLVPPTPIKKVNFEYDYSLCKKIGNNIQAQVSSRTQDANGFVNQGGKLTLKKIYFTYQNSNKARFSPYEFIYADPNHDGTEDTDYNPGYSLKACDRWGLYKPFPSGDFREVAEFPYSEQDPTLANTYASAWCLSSVKLPSGGAIKIDYEADDYAYVQDRQAMQMFKIKGVSNSSDFNTIGNELFSNDGKRASDHNRYIHFEYTDPNIKTIGELTKGISDLFFRFYINIGKKDAGQFEYVSGYVSIEDAGIDTGNKRAWIKIKDIPIGDRDKSQKVNPIAKTAWQFARLHEPEIAFGTTDAANGNDLGTVIKQIAGSSFIKNIRDMIKGVNRTLMNANKGQQIVAEKSCIRLLNSNKKKIGGGSRVSQIRINDNAQTMGIENENFDYGQTFDYTTIDEAGKIISSGVASYEPILGNEENPFRKPIAFLRKKQENLLAPDNKYYMEEPMGESFFPSAGVGYSKVTTRNLVRKDAANTNVVVTRHATGYTVQEFYTAKDFPVQFSNTDLKIKPKKSNPVFRLLKISNKNNMTASQGYVVEVNDMHGKSKAQWVYAEGKSGGEFISGVQYNYKSAGKRLINEVETINYLGQVNTKTVGMDVDMVHDFRENTSTTQHFGLHGNLESFLAAAFPAIVPMILPAYSKESVMFRSAVATKVVYRAAILEEVVAYDAGSSVNTKNLAYDAETGEVLLKETKNHFEDPVYSFTYPAHWAYDRMGGAYRNIDIIHELNFSAGAAVLDIAQTENPDYFVVGDEIAIISAPLVPDNEKAFRFWVVKKYKDSNGYTRIIIMGGDPNDQCRHFLDGVVQFKVIRSGRRNMSNFPIGALSMLQNPLVKVGDVYNDITFLQTNQILNATAQEFSDDWSIFCASCSGQAGNIINPLYIGIKGNFRAKKSHTYLTNRIQGTATKTRKDGFFTNYSNFWNTPTDPNNNREWSINPSNWTWVTESTVYDPYNSSEIENKDALLRFSAASNGYNAAVPVRVSNNSKYSDTFSDNFEDYDVSSCTENLSKFSGGQINPDISHSGRRSIKAASGGSNVTLDLIPCSK